MATADGFSRREFLTARRAAPQAAEISDACLAMAGISCMACRDDCPEDAIRFVPRLGGPFTPAIDDAACTRCGACAGVCPTAAIHIPPAWEALHA
jgi:Formate hydrogenlyase subunit 6/NADH:ubiquinone oxidoreductase 23 kD subunit (chain I)